MNAVADRPLAVRPAVRLVLSMPLDQQDWPAAWLEAHARSPREAEPVRRALVALAAAWLDGHPAAPAFAEVWRTVVAHRELLGMRQWVALLGDGVAWLEAHPDDPAGAAVIDQLARSAVELSATQLATLHRAVLARVTSRRGVDPCLLVSALVLWGTMPPKLQHRTASAALSCLERSRDAVGWAELWQALHDLHDLPERHRQRLVVIGCLAVWGRDPRHKRVAQRAQRILTGPTFDAHPLHVALRRILDQPGHDDWPEAFVAYASRTQARHDDLVGLALRWLRSNPTRRGWPRVFGLLAERVGSEHLEHHELRRLGLDWLRGQPAHVAWPDVWRRLASARRDHDLASIGRTWLVEGARRARAHLVWSRLASWCREPDPVLETSIRAWLAAHPGHGCAIVAHLRLLKLTTTPHPDVRIGHARAAVALLHTNDGPRWRFDADLMSRSLDGLPRDVVTAALAALSSAPPGTPTSVIARLRARVIGVLTAHAERPVPSGAEPARAWIVHRREGTIRAVREDADGHVLASVDLHDDGWKITLPDRFELDRVASLRLAMYATDRQLAHDGFAPAVPEVRLDDGRWVDPDHVDGHGDGDRLVAFGSFGWAAAEVQAGRGVRRRSWPRGRVWRARTASRIGSLDVVATDWVDAGDDRTPVDLIRQCVLDQQRVDAVEPRA